jgi:serine/threonine protein kinase
MTSDKQIKQRFLQEAQAAATMEHKNICAIYEVGETIDNRLFIAMAYYSGQTLEHKIKTTSLSINEIIDITIQIAHGLARAHKSQIIHRDIKPSNIIITDDNEVKIIDFGLAKLSNWTIKSHEKLILGTLVYMSPEQIYGGKIDHRSDIWSLGVVLYEMLTGKLPFKGKYEEEIAYGILNQKPELTTVFKSDIPLSIKWILEKTLAKDPEHRYQHCDEIPVDIKILQTKNHAISEIILNSKDFKIKNKWLKKLTGHRF